MFTITFIATSLIGFNVCSKPETSVKSVLVSAERSVRPGYQLPGVGKPPRYPGNPFEDGQNPPTDPDCEQSCRELTETYFDQVNACLGISPIDMSLRDPSTLPDSQACLDAERNCKACASLHPDVDNPGDPTTDPHDGKPLPNLPQCPTTIRGCIQKYGPANDLTNFLNWASGGYFRRGACEAMKRAVRAYCYVEV